jgi:hypothetical protein
VTAALCPLAPTAAQRPRFAGQLLDRTTHAPVPGAQLAVLGTSVTMQSDTAGQFTHSGLRSGVYLLQVRALGYTARHWTIELSEREPTWLVLELEPEAVTLPSVVVETDRYRARLEMAGFTRRRAAGQGVFVTEEQLRPRQGTRLSDVLHDVAGVREVCRGRTCIVRMSRSSCSPNFFMDGFPANNSTSLDMPLVGVIGIEVYRTESETPVEFLRGDNVCGAIVIWTRSGS